MAEDVWFARLGPAAPGAPRLIGFPHAGGQPAALAGLAVVLSADAELRAVYLPGRGRRVGEAPIADRERLIDALGPRLAALLDDGRPTVFLGHSMGCVVAFEACRWLRDRGHRRPDHLVVVAHRSPHTPLARPPVHAAPPEALMRELHRQGSTPDEVLASDEMMDLLLPMIRADYTIAETWHLEPEVRIDVPITAIGAWSDADVHPRAVEAWGRHTTAGFDWRMVEGDHFFLQSRPDALRPALGPILDGARRRAV